MDRKPTIIDVAQAAGVSIKTVSRVINNERYVSDDTRVRVRQAIAELGFEANVAARDMRGQVQRTHLIAQLYGDPGGVYTSDIQVGLLERCRYFGYHLLVEELDYQSPDVERRLSNLLRRYRFDGAVLTAPLTDNAAVLAALDAAGIPFVCVTPVHARADTPSVSTDERKAAYQLTQHLLSYGHRRIGFLRGLPNHAATQLRMAGFAQAMAEAGAPVDPGLIEDGNFRYFTALPCAQRLLSRPDRPTAIFASNDEMAAAVLKVAHEMEFSLPGDLSVVGFDDVPASEMLWPPLTTVRQPVQKLGAAAADLLFARLSPLGTGTWPSPVPRLILQHDVVLRGSTAAAR
ncbi:LacI family DNA-binding transcriptional regulator [Asticcacaulis solisilvae]|uniref:LacI family DNA-binding transcriptional regulator n=1 Tax=Asticcacaulis solisilvae TaxID=1217274 RepID=UPI003FD71D23